MRLYFVISSWDVLSIVTETGKQVGHVGLGVGSKLSTGLAIGYSIDEAYRGKGIIPRAVKALIEHLDNEVFQAVTLYNNEASKRVLLKCGFKHINVKETKQDPTAHWVFEYHKSNIVMEAA